MLKYKDKKMVKAPFNLLLCNLQIHLSSHEITILPLNFLNRLLFFKEFLFPSKIEWKDEINY